MEGSGALEGRVQEALAAVVRACRGTGELRPGQVAMAEAVARAVRDRDGLVVQAGTGTGKTWAYLVGALVGLEARAEEDRDDADGDGRDDGDVDRGAEARRPTVVVATATKSLQDQLADADLPAVAAALDDSLSWAVLKGRANYLCLQAASEAASNRREAALTLFDEESDDPAEAVADQVARLVAWGERTETGDRATLDFEPRAAAWSAVSMGAADCPGAARCPKGDSCFAEAAYRRARDAQVVVVNTHLLGAHVASGGHVLPEPAVVVVDEAHEAPDIVATALGVTVGPRRARRLARTVRTVAGEPAAGVGIERHADALVRCLHALAGTRLRDGAGGQAEVAEALLGLGEAVRGEQRRVREVAGAGPQAPRKERALKALAGFAEEVDALLEPDDGDVTWVELEGAEPVLRMVPVEVGGPMAGVLWGAATGILTSATVPAGLGRRLGLGSAAAELDVGTPFDYRHRAVLYVPHLPDPRRPAFEAAARDELELLVLAAGGRTLALFTSWKAMQSARAALDPRLPYRVLAQGDLPKPALLDAFRSDETSCLFATMGFWQGVDVPGPSCSLVVLDRLPFARPDDPLTQARRERAGAAAFATVDLPHAATRLAQGVGRLIRTATDRGVVAVLDRRLAEAPYRSTILAALPPMRRTRERADVSSFFAGTDG